MLHDARITHAAGIELQPGWFGLSVVLFQELRKLCVEKGFRMPSITLFRSCLLSKKPQLAYIYAISSIAYMNNEVFEKRPYFVAYRTGHKTFLSEKDVRNAPLVHLKANDPARTSLSANAACKLSKHFQNTTCIAVFLGEYFNEQFDYYLPKSMTVDTTWAQWNKTSITIKTQHQHMNIAAGNRLRCASQEYVRLWQEYMRKWSNSLTPAYLILKNEKYDRREMVVRPKGTEIRKNLFEIHSDQSSDDEVDTNDLEAVLPDTRELETTGLREAPQMFCNSLHIQILATLQQRHLLHQCILDKYMLLLEQHFDNTSFCRILMYNYKDLRAVVQKKRSEQKLFCEKYIFNANFKNRDELIFALNPGMHWIAIKIDMSKRYVATMCSLKDPLKDLAQDILQLISSIHPTAVSFQHFSVTVPHQINAVDCGPLCCMFMLFLAQNDISNMIELKYNTLLTAAAMRLRIFADIVQGQLTPLEKRS